MASAVETASLNNLRIDQSQFRKRDSIMCRAYFFDAARAVLWISDDACEMADRLFHDLVTPAWNSRLRFFAGRGFILL
jgi:hypothetical protein